MAPVPGADEVTKHSVHTLVFRSQKRAHEMFISDQGSLPDAEKDLDSFIKRIKGDFFDMLFKIALKLCIQMLGLMFGGPEFLGFGKCCNGILYHHFYFFQANLIIVKVLLNV